MYAFVVMSNHIHLIWQVQAAYTKEAVQRDFLKFTGQQMKFKLQETNTKFLDEFKVVAKNKEYQIWERNSLSIDLWSMPLLLQKLNYIHQNSVRAGLCNLPEQYHYSSAAFYGTGVDGFGFLTHINE